MKWLFRTLRVPGIRSNSSSGSASKAGKGGQAGLPPRRPSASSKRSTPMPPKPYEDAHFHSKQLIDPRYYDPDDLSHIHPETPHWKDPRYQSREKIPWFDIFAFNRDWSLTMIRIGSLVFVFAMFIEGTMLLNYQSTDMMNQSSGSDRATFKTESHSVTNEELRQAGFSVVGVKDMSVIHK